MKLRLLLMRRTFCEYRLHLSLPVSFHWKPIKRKVRHLYKNERLYKVSDEKEQVDTSLSKIDDDVPWTRSIQLVSQRVQSYCLNLYVMDGTTTVPIVNSSTASNLFDCLIGSLLAFSWLSHFFFSFSLAVDAFGSPSLDRDNKSSHYL